MLNKSGSTSRHPGEARLQYLDGDFRVLASGTYVFCAVTGDQIRLEDLKYWSVDLQEAYAAPEAVMRRHHPGIKLTP